MDRGRAARQQCEESEAGMWRADEFLWDPQNLVGARCAPSEPVRELPLKRRHVLVSNTPRRPLVCEVPGCAQCLSGPAHGRNYNIKYRVCAVHLQAEAVMPASGVLSRWCNSCSRFQPVCAFTANQRSCDAKLEAVRARRRERAAARCAGGGGGGAGQTALHEREKDEDLAAFLDLLSGPDDAPPSPLPELPALLQDALAEEACDWWATPAALPVPAPAHERVSLKLPGATPDQLPPGLRAAVGGLWGKEPLSLVALAEPGCVLLTCDLLLDAEAHARAPRLSCHAAAAALKAALGAELSNCSVALGGDGPRAPRPLTLVAVVDPESRTARVELAEAPAAGLRCRVHGRLTPLGVCGRTLTLTLPSGGPACALLDYQPVLAGGPVCPAGSQPRCIFLTSSLQLAEELREAAAAPGGDDEATIERTLLCLGTALSSESGMPPQALVAAAALLAAQRGWPVVLTALLPRLASLDEHERGRLLASSVAAGQAACTRALLRPPHFAAPRQALHAAALMAASGDDARSGKGVDAALELLLHCGDEALPYWFTAAAEVAPAAALLTPAAVAARGRSPACRGLCAQLRARLLAAQQLLASRLDALPPGTAPHSQRALLLATLLEGGAESPLVLAAARGLLLRASAAAAKGALQLEPAPRRALLLLTAFNLQAGPTFSYLLPWARGDEALSPEALHAAVQRGPLPLAFLIRVYRLHLSSIHWLVAFLVLVNLALLAPRSVVRRTLGWAQPRADALVALGALASYAMHVAVNACVWHRWRLEEAGAPLLWVPAVAAIGLMPTLTVYLRSAKLPRRQGTAHLLVRAAFLALGYLSHGTSLGWLVPQTTLSWFLPAHVVLVLGLAFWRQLAWRSGEGAQAQLGKQA